MLITVLVQSLYDIIAIAKQSGFNYKNYIMWALPEIRARLCNAIATVA